MQYLTGSSDTQYGIAGAMDTTIAGTYFSRAREYLNNNQYQNYYIARNSNDSLDLLKIDFYNAINNYYAPPLIDAKFTRANGWPYDAGNHTALITGACSDKTFFRITDPYIQWVYPSSSMFYSMAADIIHSGIKSKSGGYIF